MQFSQHWLFIICSVSLLILSCQSQDHSGRDISLLTTKTIQQVDKAHQANVLHTMECVSFDLELIFKDREVFKGRVYTKTNSSAIRLDYADGRKLLYNDGDIYTYADPIPTKKMRDKFALFTWQYFFMAPFKLADQGTHWEEKSDVTIAEKNYQSQMLTFGKDIGDAPKDWYIFHPDPQTQLIKYMGYIVTAGSDDVKKAEAHAHAISYLDYKTVQGIPFSHQWIIYDYTKDVGIGDQIGKATVSNIILEDSKNYFDPTSDIMYLKYD